MSWTVLADALLRRTVLVRRRAAPTGSLDELVLSLPSYADPGVARTVQKETRQDIDQARALVQRARNESGAFAAVTSGALLDDASVDVLAVIGAIEVDPVRRRLVAALSGTTSGTLTHGLLAEIMGSADVPLGGLRRCAYLDTPPGGGSSWADRPVPLAASVVSALSGSGIVEPLLAGLVTTVETSGRGSADLLIVAGADRGSRRRRSSEVARAGALLVLDQPEDESQMAAAVRLATLTHSGLLVEIDDVVHPGTRRWVEEARHLAWVLSSEHDLPLEALPRRSWTEQRVQRIRVDTKRLAALVGEEAAQGQRLDLEQMDLVERTVAGLEVPASALRRLASGELDRLADRLVPRRTWKDLVLDDEQRLKLEEVVLRFRHRNRVFDEWGFAPAGSVGVTALFAGQPGTGKTLSAEVVAAELGLDLYRIDLSSTVSKFIGETEKNLEALFRAAELADVVLLFDEADSLFGKRSEVSDAQDRYANLETAYLLQRLERFTGVAVLTTNLASNIDQAFMRRIDVSVTFGMPEVPERRRIWEVTLPSSAPLDDIDLDFLAQEFRIAGGAIRNVALTAAFLAAEEGTAIGMRHVVQGLRRESAKMSRLVEPSQFGKYASLLEVSTDLRPSSR